jgi:predicted PurR-regulated permease PerM
MKKIELMKSENFFNYVLIGSIILTIYMLWSFLTVIVLALITVMIFAPIYDKIYTKTKMRAKLTTLFTLIVILFTVLIPSAIVFSISVNEIQDIYRNISSKNLSLGIIIPEINSYLDYIPYNEYQITEEEAIDTIKGLINPVRNFIVNQAPSVLSTSTEIILQLTIYLIMVLSLLPNKDYIKSIVMKLIPLDDNLLEIYAKRIHAMVLSMVKGTVIIATAQAVLAGLLMWVFGISHVLFLTILMIILGFIPVVGFSLVTYPAALYLILTGNVVQGIILIVASLVVISNIDNVLRPYLVSSDAKLNAVLTILGVIAGVKMFGLIGLIFGPVIMIIFTTTIETYLKHYKPNQK